MAELKTKPSTLSVDNYLNQLDTSKQNDAKILIEMMQEITHHQPVMWGDSMIGFDQVHMKYASGREIDYFALGFSVRKKALTLYLSIDVNKKVFDSLGKHQKGVGCLYISKMSDINIEELKKILEESYHYIKSC